MNFLNRKLLIASLLLTFCNVSFAQTPPEQAEQALTQEQQTLISDTLQQYDANNLTEDDAKSIMKVLIEAKIQPSRALATYMDELGFDVRAIAEAAHMQPEGNRPPPNRN